MNKNSSRDDSFLKSNKNLIDMPNDYDEDEEEEDLSLFKTAIYTKETPKDALIAKTAPNLLQITDANDTCAFLSPQSTNPNSAQNSNHTSNNSINSCNSCKYNSSNNSIQSISSSSPLVTTSSPSADTPTSNVFVIPSVKITDEDQDSFSESSICRKNDNNNSNSSNNNNIVINNNNHSKKKIDNSKTTKNASKRRNTISSIAVDTPSETNTNNITSSFGNSLSPYYSPNTASANIKSSKSKSSVISKLNCILDSDIFEIIEKGDVDQLQHKLVFNSSCINRLNSYEFAPLDMALMLNYVPIIRVLLSNGARENPNLKDCNDKYKRICTALTDLDKTLRNLLESFDVANMPTAQIIEYDNKLKDLDTKIKLVKKMKSNIEFATPPDAPSNVILEPNGAGSLVVYFEEPVLNSGSFIYKYLIEWSTNASFDPIEGEIALVEINKNKKCIINNLNHNQNYYVRVSCANIKGFGTYSFSSPISLIPSFWRDGKSVKENEMNQIKKLTELNDLINKSREDSEFLSSNDLNSTQKFSKPRKELKKNIKSLFSLALNSNQSSSNSSKPIITSNKFAKQIKKGSAYMLMIIYDGDKILTTYDDTLPMIEIDENYSGQTLNNDLQFLIKLSINWTEIDYFKTSIEQTINTTSLRFRYQIISVIKQIQTILDIKNLGQVYYQCIKHSNNVFFVISKNLQNTPLTNQTLSQQLKLVELEKFLLKQANNSNAQASQKSASSTTYMDHGFLLKQIKTVIEFDRSCDRKLARGLYVAYLKTQSGMDLVTVMVSSQIPSIIPCYKVRDNPNVTREEWNLIKSIGTCTNGDYNSFFNEMNYKFLSNVIEATNQLINQLDLKDVEIDSLRVVTKELIEINDDITLMLICPSTEKICMMNTASTTPTSSASSNNQDLDSTPTSSGGETQNTFLPVQIFEAIHLNSYGAEFIRFYVRMSILIEIECLASSQYQREAFSNDEILKSKKFFNTSNKYQKLLEELWKESRWIIEAINLARDKQTNQNLICALNQFKSALNSYTLMLMSRTTNTYKTNIYNQITKLPFMNSLSTTPTASATTTTTPTSFHHIDSILIDDDYISSMSSAEDLNVFKRKHSMKNELNSDYFLNSSFKKCDTSQCERNTHRSLITNNYEEKNTNSVKWKSSRSNRSNSLAPSHTALTDQTIANNNSNNIYNLVTKLYISSPSIPSRRINNVSNDEIGSLYLKAKFTGANNSSNRSLNSLPNKIFVFIDFQTGLKIETFFECTITTLRTCREIIFHIIRKLNNLITKLNKLKQLTDLNFVEYYEDIIKVENSKEDERYIKLMSLPSKFKLNTYELTVNLDENLNLYSLVIVVDSNEKVLCDNFYLAQLKEPWTSGRFYLKKNNLV